MNRYEISNDDEVLGIYEGNSCYEAFIDMIRGTEIRETTDAEIEHEWEITTLDFVELDRDDDRCGCLHGCMECLMLNY